MDELLLHGSKVERPKREHKTHLICLAKGLGPRFRALPFPGVSQETVRQLRLADEEHPGYATPTDTLIEKMKKGIKIVMGEDWESGNVFVIPVTDGDIETDSLLPRHLETTHEMYEWLRSLILIHKVIYE